jgi:predicted phage terminase large subunit-like protein
MNKLIAPAEFHRRALRAALRKDPRAFLHRCFRTLAPGAHFIPEWYIDAVLYQLERVRRGELRRLILNMSPRSLKSMMASVAFPAYVLGHDPTRRIICVSYAAELSNKMSNDFRSIINTDWYKQTFPETRIGAYKDSEGEIEFTRRGFRLATSVGGTLTGRGGDIIIIDDPLKPLDAISDAKRMGVNQWYNNTLLSRLDDKQKGAIIIVMQRVHMDDLTGFVTEHSDEWEILSLPAIADVDSEISLLDGKTHYRKIGEVLSQVREPLHVLESLRKELGSDLFCAQYLQFPMPPGGAMVKRAWVKRYTGAPIRDRDTFVQQSWDIATKGGPQNDWSVCTTWYITLEKFVLVDVKRIRVDYPAVRRELEEHARNWQADEVLVEDVGTGSALLQELEYKVRGLVGIKPDRDKQARMSVASAKIEAGQVFLPEQAPWLPDFEAELFAFPGSKYDDQVDSVSQALNHYSERYMWWRLVD